MNLSLDIEIREKLASYFGSEISLEEFEDWFVSASWNIMQREKMVVIDLVYDIELLLAEYSDNCWNEGELKDHLLPYIKNYKVEMEYYPIIAMDSVAKFESYPLLSASFGI